LEGEKQSIPEEWNGVVQRNEGAFNGFSSARWILMIERGI